MAEAKWSVPLMFSAQEAVARTNEPVTIGLPWPKGAISDERYFRLIAPNGESQTLQTKVLDRWPDGSIRWCLFDFLATWDGTTAASGYWVKVGTTPNETQPFTSNGIPGVLFQIKNKGEYYPYQLASRPVHEPGAIRSRISIEEHNWINCKLMGHYDKFVNSSVIRITITVQNPQATNHPGGNWDLGNTGYVDIEDFRVSIGNSEGNRWSVSLERNQQFQIVSQLDLHQHSSGGDHWQSANHLDRNHKIPLSRQGYTAKLDGVETCGNRATPIIVSETVGLAVPYFWENFPKTVSTTTLDWTIQFQLFPGSNELQGGEQKTHMFYLAFGKDTITEQPMVWCRSPIIACAEPSWYAASGAIPYLTPKADDPHAEYLALVDQAIEGPDTFLHKREKIDEYGWRHFGDIWGDHEAVYWPGQEPMISHYNNQYDCVAGFLYQYLRSSDTRWLSQGLECAEHTCDIDVYHTTGDKSAYNGGLFWHTYHYAPADTGTHRSYPRSLRTGNHFESGQDLSKMGDTGATLKQKIYAVGGGPSAAHNYNHGLMLAYYLTGNPLFRETALGLAQFVLNMDDGKKTVFRWLCTGDTGLSIQSSDGYLGPGRASANSLLAVMVGHQLSGDGIYLDKANEIVRRVVHPKQNLERLDLLNAELRWFYTMFLQALGRYLDYKAELGQLDEHYTYARLSILHYARYMAQHERPILSKPEKLQYPTETWAAQDMRKVEVFQYAAKHATGTEREKFLERAEWFFNYVVRTLVTFPPTDRGIATKSLCRPVILMMKYGWSRNWWRLNPTAAAPEPLVKKSADDFGTWTMFVPQKVKAIKRAKQLIAVGGVTSFVLLIALIFWLLR